MTLVRADNPFNTPCSALPLSLASRVHWFACGTRTEGNMIDLTTEKPLTLWQAANLVPPARQGKRTNASTIFRWIRDGAKRPTGEVVRLDALKLPNRWVTSAAALQRFLEALTPSVEGPPATVRPPARRERASARAERELTRLGI